MEDKVILIGFYYSMFGMRVRTALALKGIEYEYREENPTTKSPFLLEMNPVHKKIPVLIHNGKPVCESNIIVQYIDEVWNDRAPLLPSDPYQRAQARFWSDFIDKKVCDAGRIVWTTKEEDREATKIELIDILKELEGQLGNKPYFGGDRLGFLDVAFLPFTTWFYSYETCGSFSIKDHCPKLINWADKCKEIDAVSKSLADPHKIYDFVLCMKKKYNII